MILQYYLQSSKHLYNNIKAQSSTLCSAQIPLPYETSGQTNIFREFLNAYKSWIAISNNREVGNKIHGPYIKPSDWNRNRIQQPMRSSSEITAPLIHATTLNELFCISYHAWPPHTMIKRIEHFINAQVAHKVTAMKFSK